MAVVNSLIDVLTPIIKSNSKSSNNTFSSVSYGILFYFVDLKANLDISLLDKSDFSELIKFFVNLGTSSIIDGLKGCKSRNNEVSIVLIIPGVEISTKGFESRFIRLVVFVNLKEA